MMYYMIALLAKLMKILQIIIMNIFSQIKNFLYHKYVMPVCERFVLIPVHANELDFPTFRFGFEKEFCITSEEKYIEVLLGISDYFSM